MRPACFARFYGFGFWMFRIIVLEGSILPRKPSVFRSLDLYFLWPALGAESGLGLFWRIGHAPQITIKEQIKLVLHWQETGRGS